MTEKRTFTAGRHRSVRWMLAKMSAAVWTAALLFACAGQPPSLAASPASVSPSPTPIPASQEPSLAPSATPGSEGPPEFQVPAPHLIELLQGVSRDRLRSDVESLAAIHSRHVNNPGVAEAAVFLRRSLAGLGGGWEVSDQAFPLDFNDLTTSQINLIARLPGSDPAAGSILVGAHYDSRTVTINDAESPAPGANDNASGVAALLEIGRALAGETPRRTILLMAFTGEEVGMHGSRHAVGEFLARGERIHSVIVLDILGNAAGPDGKGSLRVFSAPPENSLSRRLAWTVAALGLTALPTFEGVVQADIDRPDRYSDHVPFSEAGIPAVRLIEKLETLPRQHTGLDLPEALDYSYLRLATQLALNSVLNLAYGPPEPENLSLDRNGEQPALIWEPVEGAAAYLIVLVRGPETKPELQLVPSAEIRWAGESLQDPRYRHAYVAAIDSEGWIGGLSAAVSLAP